MKNKTRKGFSVRQEGYRQVIQLRTSWLARIAASLFLTVWLSGWSAGCSMIIFGLVKDFSWFLLLFSIPFIVGWFAGAFSWLASLFGKQLLILEKDHLELEFSVLIPVSRKRISYKEILSIELTTLDDSTAIEIQSAGKPLRFGLGYKRQVLEELREHLLAEIPMASKADKSNPVGDPVRL